MSLGRRRRRVLILYSSAYCNVIHVSLNLEEMRLDFEGNEKTIEGGETEVVRRLLKEGEGGLELW